MSLSENSLTKVRTPIRSLGAVRRELIPFSFDNAKFSVLGIGVALIE